MVVDRGVVFEALPPVMLNALVPRTNPYNRFNQDVLVTGFLNGADPTRVSTDSLLVRGSVSLRGKIREWEGELSLLRSEEDAEVRLDNVFDPLDPLDRLRLAQVLNDSDPDRTLNLLGPGPLRVAKCLLACCGRRKSTRLSTDATQLTGARERQTFSRCQPGKVEMIVGTEWRKEAVQFDSLFGAFEREVAGGFAELEVPLLGESMQFPAARELTLTLAGRFDRYTDFGEIFSPQYGLVWRPLRDVAVRATYGRSFRAPSLVRTVSAACSGPRRWSQILGAASRTAWCSWPAGTLSSKPRAVNPSRQGSSSLRRRSRRSRCRRPTGASVMSDRVIALNPAVRRRA